MRLAQSFEDDEVGAQGGYSLGAGTIRTTDGGQTLGLGRVLRAGITADGGAAHRHVVGAQLAEELRDGAAVAHAHGGSRVKSKPPEPQNEPSERHHRHAVTENRVDGPVGAVLAGAGP